MQHHRIVNSLALAPPAGYDRGMDDKPKAGVFQRRIAVAGAITVIFFVLLSFAVPKARSPIPQITMCALALIYWAGLIVICLGLFDTGPMSSHCSVINTRVNWWRIFFAVIASFAIALTTLFIVVMRLVMLDV